MKKYKCDICNKSLSSAQRVKTHKIAKHNKIKKYLLPSRNKKTKEKQQHRCSKCERVFT